MTFILNREITCEIVHRLEREAELGRRPLVVIEAEGLNQEYVALLRARSDLWAVVTDTNGASASGLSIHKAARSFLRPLGIVVDVGVFNHRPV